MDITIGLQISMALCPSMLPIEEVARRSRALPSARLDHLVAALGIPNCQQCQLISIVVVSTNKGMPAWCLN